MCTKINICIFFGSWGNDFEKPQTCDAEFVTLRVQTCWAPCFAHLRGQRTPIRTHALDQKVQQSVGVRQTVLPRKCHRRRRAMVCVQQVGSNSFMSKKLAHCVGPSHNKKKSSKKHGNYFFGDCYTARKLEFKLS